MPRDQGQALRLRTCGCQPVLHLALFGDVVKDVNDLLNTAVFNNGSDRPAQPEIGFILAAGKHFDFCRLSETQALEHAVQLCLVGLRVTRRLKQGLAFQLTEPEPCHVAERIIAPGDLPAGICQDDALGGVLGTKGELVDPRFLCLQRIERVNGGFVRRQEHAEHQEADDEDAAQQRHIFDHHLNIRGVPGATDDDCRKIIEPALEHDLPNAIHFNDLSLQAELRFQILIEFTDLIAK